MRRSLALASWRRGTWARLRSLLPSAARRGLRAALGLPDAYVWADAIRSAERDPLLERYRATRPRGPLRHHVGVTVSPAHPDGPAFTAAAAELGGRVTLFDPDDPDWPTRVRAAGCDGHLVRLRHGRAIDWSLDQARLAFLHGLGVPTWPRPHEAFLYEDKARAAWWLEAHGVPHVPTRVFTRLDDALPWLERAAFPLVVKTRFGSGGSGVERVDDLGSARAAARLFLRGRYHRRGADWRDGDHGYLIVQPWWPFAAEHRVIRLGDVWFAHGKVLARGDWRFSGSGVRDWELPGLDVLDRGLEVAARLDLRCGAIDLLVREDGSWFVGEVQTWYAGFRASQMDVGGVPHVAYREGARWRLQEGMPHVHRGQALRLLAFDAWLDGAGDAPVRVSGSGA